jgi:hypothetical protein
MIKIFPRKFLKFTFLFILYYNYFITCYRRNIFSFILHLVGHIAVPFESQLQITPPPPFLKKIFYPSPPHPYRDQRCGRSLKIGSHLYRMGHHGTTRTAATWAQSWCVPSSPSSCPSSPSACYTVSFPPTSPDSPFSWWGCTSVEWRLRIGVSIPPPPGGS